MTETARDARASALFLALSGIPPGERDAWLAAACGGDLDLRRQVESLLGGLDAPSEFLDPAALHPPAIDADTPLVAGTRLGDFTIQRVIGAGSAGIVYSALQRRPQRVVALKVLRRDLAASSVKRRFEAEAELLGRLQHPGIAQIFAAHAGDEHTPPYIAMELVEGPPITEHVAGIGSDPRTRVELVARVCDAVQHAHQRGVIHRDLKPGNVLVGRDGQPKVLDFGVARASGADIISGIHTEVGQLVGTVPYMSPEQIAGVPDDVDTRSDVYALGVILFRLLAGHLPFAADDPPLPELARRIAQDTPPRLADVDRSLGGDLDAILTRALAKDKERRYSSAADLADDLRRWLGGQPVSASADSAWYVLRTQLARYRRALAASLAAFIALGALTAYALVQRSLAERTNVFLADELAASNIERGKLLGRAGNLFGAEALLWDELFRQPESRHVRWALWEIYSREPSIWTRILDAGTDTVAFDASGGRLYAGGVDGRVRVLEPISGETRQVLTMHDGPVRLLAVAPDGSLVSGARDGLRIWRSDGELAFLVPVPDGEPTALALLGSEIVASAAGGRVRLWSMRDGQPLATFELPGSTIARLAASSAGDTLAAGTSDGWVMIWDPARQLVRWRQKAHEGSISALIFNPASGMLMSGGFDQRITVLEPASGRLVAQMTPNNGTVRWFAFDRAGRRLALAGWWRTPVLDMEDDGREIGGISQGVWRVALSPDGRLLATCDDEGGPVRLWDLDATPRVAHSQPHQTRVIGVEVLASGRHVVTAATGATMRGLHADSHAATFDAAHHADLIGLALIDGDRHALVLDAQARLTMWDVASGAKQHEIAIGSPADTSGGQSAPSALATSPGDGLVVAGSADGRLQSWQWTGDALVPGFDVASTDGEVLRVAIHGDRLAVAHRSRAILLRRRDGTLVNRLQTTTAPFVVTFSPNGRQLAAGTWTGIVELWSPLTGERTLLAGHSRLVTGLDFSSDGTLLVSASRDGTVRLWDAVTGRSLATVATRAVGASRVRFLPGERLVVAYDSGEVETIDIGYVFRHVAGQAEYQRQFRERLRGSPYPRGDEVLTWSRRILDRP